MLHADKQDGVYQRISASSVTLLSFIPVRPPSPTGPCTLHHTLARQKPVCGFTLARGTFGKQSRRFRDRVTPKMRLQILPSMMFTTKGYTVR